MADLLNFSNWNLSQFVNKTPGVNQAIEAGEGVIMGEKEITPPANLTGGSDALGAILSGGIPIPDMTGGEASGSAESTGMFNDRSPIHVAPVGVNLGAILQPFNQGSEANGGYGLDLMSRFIDRKYATTDTAITGKSSPFTSNIPWEWIIGGMVVLGVGYMAFMR